MNHWKILGIEATTDKRLIKLAYTELLKKTSPTEFPEEFKNLRKALTQQVLKSSFSPITLNIRAECCRIRFLRLHNAKVQTEQRGT